MEGNCGPGPVEGVIHVCEKVIVGGRLWRGPDWSEAAQGKLRAEVERLLDRMVESNKELLGTSDRRIRPLKGDRARSGGGDSKERMW